MLGAENIPKLEFRIMNVWQIYCLLLPDALRGLNNKIAIAFIDNSLEGALSVSVFKSTEGFAWRCLLSLAEMVKGLAGF